MILNSTGTTFHPLNRQANYREHLSFTCPYGHLFLKMILEQTCLVLARWPTTCSRRILSSRVELLFTPTPKATRPNTTFAHIHAVVEKYMLVRLGRRTWHWDSCEAWRAVKTFPLFELLELLNRVCSSACNVAPKNHLELPTFREPMARLLSLSKAGPCLNGQFDWLCVRRQKSLVWLHPSFGKEDWIA